MWKERYRCVINFEAYYETRFYFEKFHAGIGPGINVAVIQDLWLMVVLLQHPSFRFDIKQRVGDYLGGSD